MFSVPKTPAQRESPPRQIHCRVLIEYSPPNSPHASLSRSSTRPRWSARDFLRSPSNFAASSLLISYLRKSILILQGRPPVEYAHTNSIPRLFWAHTDLQLCIFSALCQQAASGRTHIRLPQQNPGYSLSQKLHIQPFRSKIGRAPVDQVH